MTKAFILSALAHNFFPPVLACNLKEISQNLSSQVFSPGFFMIHDAAGGCQHNVPAI